MPSIAKLHTACPYCRHPYEGVIVADDDHAPGPGDYTRCGWCEGMAVLDQLLDMREPTADELSFFEKMAEMPTPQQMH